MSIVKMDPELNRFMATECSSRMLSPFKQNVVCMVNGAAGSGKSYLSLRLATQIAEIVAPKLNRKPEEVFNLRDNTGIILWDNILKMFEHADTHDHCVYICDDSAVSLNSRRFQTDNNVSQNDRMQTMRARSHCIIYTCINSRLIDIVARLLSGYKIEMKKPLHSLGLNVCTIKSVEVNSQGELYYPFLQTKDGCKIVEHYFERPDKSLTDEYDRLREQASDELNKRARERMEKANKDTVQKVSKKDEILKGHNDWMDGMYGDMPWNQVCKNNGWNVNYANKVVSENQYE